MEFLRRFVQHILPPSFQRVRYYGFYVGAAKTKLENAKQKIGNRDWCYTLRTVVQIITAMIGLEPDVCPCCGARGQWLVEILPAGYWPKPPGRFGAERAAAGAGQCFGGCCCALSAGAWDWFAPGEKRGGVLGENLVKTR